MAPPTAMSVTSSVGVAAHHVTEDTPPDFFEGCMDLLVWLPNHKRIPVSVERKMPLMDLLVHVTTSNKISPGSHVLQLTDSNGMQLPYKPSTPIGSLNAHHVYVIPKNRLSDKISTNQQQVQQQQQQQPFEPTCRVQVRLPRNQLSVVRVSPRTPLSEILVRVCQERNLDPNKYELRHPVNLDERLRLSCTLSDYRLQEVVLAVSGHGAAGALSVSDLSAMKKNGSAAPAPSTKMAASSGQHAEKKRSKGFLGFMFGRKRSSVGDSSVSSESAGDRSLSPSHSDDGPPSAGISPPSPLLVSKRVAGEAAAKRNSQPIASSTGEASCGAPTLGPDSHSPGLAELKLAARQKKRPAPLPPPFGAGHQVAESIISSCSSSSESTAVSLPPSVVAQSPVGSDGASDISSGYHESGSSRKSAEPPVIARAKKLDQQSPRSQSVMNLASGAPKSAANSKKGRSSMSNLTQVNSTSESSISAALKKRKAPAPPPLYPPAQVAAAAAAAVPAAPPALAVEEDQVLQDATDKADHDDNDDSYEEVDFSPVTTERKPDVSVVDDPSEIAAETEPVYAVVVKKSKTVSTTDSEEKPSITTVTSVSESPIMWEYKLPEPPGLPDIQSTNLKNQMGESESETESRAPLEKALEFDEEESTPTKHGEMVCNEEAGQISHNTVVLQVLSREAVSPVAALAEQFEASAPLQMSTPRDDFSSKTEAKGLNFHPSENVESESVVPQTSPVEIDPLSPIEVVCVHGENPMQPTSSLDAEDDTPVESATPTDDSSGVFSDDVQSSSTSLEKETDEHDAEDRSLVIPVDSAACTMSPLVSVEIQLDGDTLKGKLPAVSDEIPAESLDITVKDISTGSLIVTVNSTLPDTETEDVEKIPGAEITALKPESTVVFAEEPQQCGSAAVTLTSGSELQQESVTEEEAAAPGAVEPQKLLLTEDPAHCPFGAESSTDEVVKIAVIAEPVREAVEKSVGLGQGGPMNAGMTAEIQPTIEKKTERQRPDLMRFSISSYSQRIELDGVTYEKKLSRAESFNVGSKPKPAAAVTVARPLPVTKPDANRTETSVKKTESFVTKKNLVLQTPDSKAPPAAESQTLTKETQETSRSDERKVNPSDPVLNFIDQAKALLVSAPDPRAKSLEEEFLKLQQQFLAWQQQQQHRQEESIAEDKDVEVQAEIVEADQTGDVDEKPDEKEDPNEEKDSPEEPKQTDAQPVAESPKQRLLPVHEEEAGQSSAGSDAPQREIRFQGPPQVKLDTWKPGRPRPEVIDLSREPCFVVPDLRSVLLSQSAAADEHEKTQHSECEPPPKEVPAPVSSVTRASLLTRKASIDAPRPFQLHTNQTIKRPSFQFTKPLANWAPEVRGFAHIPAVSSQTAADAPHESTPVQRLREQLIASARKPSAETTAKLDSSVNHSNPLEHPIPMPMSSSLLLAATKHIEGPPAPPPPPTLPQFCAAPQKKEVVKARPVIAVDSREELLSSIKNFSSGPGLKKVRGLHESAREFKQGPRPVKRNEDNSSNEIHYIKAD